MYDARDLKPRLSIAEGQVDCPVLGCPTRVPLQQRSFRRLPEYACPAHGLYLGRSTFEYAREADNLLCRSPQDLRLLQAIRACKRESRMARERSEDALSWNLFRHLETSGRLRPWLARTAGTAATEAAVHYWSFDASRQATWTPLAQARAAFGEAEHRGSEPDIVITTEDTHLWIEAKFGSSNDTRPSDTEGAMRRYTTGGGGWYAEVVKDGSDFETVAVRLRRYELLRLWLLGSWAAAQQGKRFVLLNLVRAGSEEDVCAFAAQHLQQCGDRALRQITWESVVDTVEAAPPHDAADLALLDYMRFKTMGRDSAGRLLRAFALDDRRVQAS